MASTNLLAFSIIAYISATALASPFPEAEPDLHPQISLPPLIPSVPGVMDPIGTLVPPLPVLQAPTPPKSSPPFVGSDIKPKKIGHFWTAAGDNDHAGKAQLSTPSLKANSCRLEFLATYSLDDRIHLGGGNQNVKFIPGNPDSAALATAVHLGQVWIIYPFKTGANGKQGTAELLYDLGPQARDTAAI
ncbi:hypothetical protein MMC30_001551 [Trapelia coarctata]|nr:hypothetical protein [Trapelia coarctata]